MTDEMRWQPAARVTSCAHGDVTIILSLDTGRYATLDDVGGQIWSRVCQSDSIDRIARDIASDCGLNDVATIERDVTEFLRSLEDKRLIERVGAGSAIPKGVVAQNVTRSISPGQPMLSASPLRPPSAPLCLMVLVCIDVVLRMAGLRRLLSRLLRPRPATPATVPLSASWLGDLVRNVRIAAAAYPLRAACLEQSLCILWAIRRSGGDARLRFGAAPFPFRAHAWVEYLGSPVNEDDETLAPYRVMPEIEFEAL